MPRRYPIPAEEPTYTGEGITRTSDPAARLWAVTIAFSTPAKPLRCSIRAISAGQAEAFAFARHLNVRRVEVHDAA